MSCDFLVFFKSVYETMQCDHSILYWIHRQHLPMVHFSCQYLRFVLKCEFERKTNVFFRDLKILKHIAKSVRDRSRALYPCQDDLNIFGLQYVLCMSLFNCKHSAEESILCRNSKLYGKDAKLEGGL